VETSCVLIGALLPQDVPQQLKGHLEGALNGGAQVEEIRAVREVVIRICESAGMKRLEGTIGYGWQYDIVDI
jgi:alkylhydroperoxidase/carboxymuconolactone decarboxylase family protein YurZ